MRDVIHNRLGILLESMRHGADATYSYTELATILREESARGFQDGDRDMNNNVIIYTLSPDAMPADIKSDTDFTIICTNVAGSPDVVRAVNEAITDAAEFQRGGGLHPVPTTNRNYVTANHRRFVTPNYHELGLFEQEISALAGKIYPEEFTAEFVGAKAACDPEFLDMIATDSMNSSDEVSNAPRAEYLYKRLLSNGGKQTEFAPYVLREVVEAVHKLDQDLNA